MEGGWFDQEAIEDERFEADMMQRQYEEESARYMRRKQRSEEERAAGRFEAAARLCPHSGGYPLCSPAAEHESDPNAGEYGWRCSDCGSRLTASPWDGGTVAVPCERKREVTA